MDGFVGTREDDRIDVKSMGARGQCSAANRMSRDAIIVIGFADTGNSRLAMGYRAAAIVFPRATRVSSSLATMFRDEIPLFCRDAPLFSRNVPQRGSIAPLNRCDVPQQNELVPLFRCDVPLFRCDIPQQRDVAPQQRGVIPLFRRYVPLFRGKTSLFPNLVALQRLDEAMYSHEPCAGSHAGSPKPGHRSTVFR